MWTGPLACLSLSSVVVVDKDPDSRSGIGSLLLLLPINVGPNVLLDVNENSKS